MRLPHVYLVAWPAQRIIKPGYSAQKRWRAFQNRGADLLFLSCLASVRDAFALEEELHAIVRYALRPAFTARSDAEPFLGGRGAGWLECSRADSQETFDMAAKLCVEAMQEADAWGNAWGNAWGIGRWHMHGRDGRNGLTQSPTPDSDIRLVPNAHEIRAMTGDGNG